MYFILLSPFRLCVVLMGHGSDSSAVHAALFYD